jgi:translation initiation factor 2 beta subunit (eIF-2beta)/eIF-5
MRSLHQLCVKIEEAIQNPTGQPVSIILKNGSRVSVSIHGTVMFYLPVETVTVTPETKKLIRDMGVFLDNITTFEKDQIKYNAMSVFVKSDPQSFVKQLVNVLSTIGSLEGLRIQRMVITSKGV